MKVQLEKKNSLEKKNGFGKKFLLLVHACSRNVSVGIFYFFTRERWKNNDHEGLGCFNGRIDWRENRNRNIYNIIKKEK